MTTPIYVLGTGLSHNGSAVLLKDGRVCVWIEKERITRRKHDGGNDSAAIRYCLDAEGITIEDVAVVVQSANFEVPARAVHGGPRVLAGSAHPPLVSISHHLAHAWSAAGTTPFDTCGIMVIDGCGSPIDQCTDLEHGVMLHRNDEAAFGIRCEKDSFYHFDGRDVTALCKDFSIVPNAPMHPLRMPATRHSIGGFYAAVSRYVFGDMDDVGKLMGLAPYGRAGVVTGTAFAMTDGRLFVTEDWKATLTDAAEDYAAFRAKFQYYADIACWAQSEVERAVAAIFRDRLARFPHAQLCYTGGVALNAVANARLLDDGVVDALYLEPAAGDNGLALGCAYYGWMKVLGRDKVPHDGDTCFGRWYTRAEIHNALTGWDAEDLPHDDMTARVAQLLADGKTVAWFQGGSEFGPRALGHRSILAHPGTAGLRDHINAAIKFREDFRPFAPAALPAYAAEWFESGRDSPYMILVDRTKSAHRAALCNVTHVDGTARVQTVDARWNAAFADLIEAFRVLSGIPVLLNTSLNRRGMPIVETPAQAVALFAETALDALVLENFLVTKPPA